MDRPATSASTNPSLRLLTLAKGTTDPRHWNPLFIRHLNELGELTVEEKAADWDEDRLLAACRAHDVILTDWGSLSLPERLADNVGRLRYVCNITGSIRAVVPRRLVEAGIAVTNWGDFPAHGVAEGALTLLLAVLKQLVLRRETIAAGDWALKDAAWSGSVRDLRIGVYGLGVIGRTFLELVRPLQPRLCAFDPYLVEWPGDLARADSLDALFDRVEAVVVAAALTDETRGSITAKQLAALPDGGVIVNVARGAIIDQPALFAELEAGRLRAGLDVLDTDGKDWLEPEHPARHWPNLLLTAHKVAGDNWNQELYGKDQLTRHQEVCLENLKRFAEGRPLRHSFDLVRYDRST